MCVRVVETSRVLMMMPNDMPPDANTDDGESLFVYVRTHVAATAATGKGLD